jgi:hypothetical protein
MEGQRAERPAEAEAREEPMRRQDSHTVVLESALEAQAAQNYDELIAGGAGVVQAYTHIYRTYGDQLSSEFYQYLLRVTLTVGEAQACLEALFQSGKSMSTVKDQITRILDAVWLRAYQEGLAGTFEPPTV